MFSLICSVHFQFDSYPVHERDEDDDDDLCIRECTPLGPGLFFKPGFTGLTASKPRYLGTWV